MNRKKIAAFTFGIGLMAVLAGCGKQKSNGVTDSDTFAVNVRYTIDGKATNELPDGMHYDFVSVSGGESLNAEWDEASWTLVTDEAESGTYTCTVDFTATTAIFKMNNVGYASLQAAFDAASSNPTVIECLQDYEGHGITSADSQITLRLNGHTIDGIGSDTIVNRGTLSIVGDGTITNTVDGKYTKTLINYGTLELTDLTISNATSNATIWNSQNAYSVMDITNCSITHEIAESNVIINSGTMNLHSGILFSDASEGYSLLKINHEDAIVNYYDGTFACTGDGFTVTLLFGSFRNYSDHDITQGNQLGDYAKAHSAEDDPLRQP